MSCALPPRTLGATSGGLEGEAGETGRDPPVEKRQPEELEAGAEWAEAGGCEEKENEAWRHGDSEPQVIPTPPLEGGLGGLVQVEDRSELASEGADPSARPHAPSSVP